jgi:hypothetical protein
MGYWPIFKTKNLRPAIAKPECLYLHTKAQRPSRSDHQGMATLDITHKGKPILVSL